MNLRRLTATACLAVSALVLAGGVGDVQPPVAAWLGLTALAAWVWSWLAAPHGWRTVPALVMPAAIVAAATTAFLPQQGMPVLTLVAVVAATRLALELDPPDSRLLDEHLLWSYFFALGSVLYRQEPYCRALADELCRATGRWLAVLFEQPWAPGSTALGFQAIVAYFLFAGLAVRRAPRRWRLSTTTVAALLLAASLAVYTLGAWALAAAYRNTAHFATLPEPGEVTHAGQHHAAPFAWVTPLAAMYPMSYQPILIALLLGSGALVARMLAHSAAAASGRDTAGAARRTGHGPRRGWRALRTGALAVAFAGTAAAALVIWPAVAGYARPRDLRIFVHKLHIDWQAPRYGAYGDRSGGMFGLLADHARCHGHQVTAMPLADETKLDDFDVLVLINLQEYFSEESKSRILDFVRDGGGLLIAGDHTGVSGLREPANHLVRDLGIELNFDSAKPFSPGWTDGFEYLSHPVTRGLAWWFNEPNIWIGASLTVRRPAYPLVLGRCAFSDPGDMTSPRGYLGDMKYSPGERLGDLPLVAAREYGRGRIIVWGDTSPLQNMAWTFSHRYMERTLGWLGSRGGNAPAWARLPAAFVFFGCAAALILLAHCSWRAPVAAAVAIGLLALVRVADRRAPDDVVSGPRAYIDLAHLPDANLEIWLRDGFAGMAQTMARGGLFPYALGDWEREPWEAARLIVFVSPIKPLAPREQERLIAYVGRGGEVLICLGWEQSAGWAPFLSRLGLKLVKAPLGQLDGESWEGESVHFQSAWPVAVGASPEVPLRIHTLVSVGGQPCAVRAEAHGGGAITLVGDSRFLRNVNLEDRFEFVEPNVRFFRRYIEAYVYDASSADGPARGVAASPGPTDASPRQHE